jgi:hypothetical protein
MKHNLLKGSSEKLGPARRPLGPSPLALAIPAAIAACRPGNVVSIFTGPPVDEQDDGEAVRRFMNLPGKKVVCGGTTADIVARWLGERIRIHRDPHGMIALPRYEVAGVDLVTEGAITLNQAYNLLDTDAAQLKDDNGATELCSLLLNADCVHLLHGKARNTAMDMLSFRRQGILARSRILARLADKLKTLGKLIAVHSL